MFRTPPRKAVVNAFLLCFFGTWGAVALARADHFPFARFAMFSTPRLSSEGAFDFTVAEARAITHTGASFAIVPQMGLARLLYVIRYANERPAAERAQLLEGVARSLIEAARTQSADPASLSSIEISQVAYRVPFPHPELAIRGEAELLHRIEVEPNGPR